MVTPPRTILVINVTRIGDTLAATPAIHALHERWPEAEIIVLGSPKRISVLENLSFISRVGTITKKTAPFLGWLSGKKIDLAIVNNFDTALVSYALRVARHVVAYRQEVPAINRRLYCCVEPVRPNNCHLTDMMARLVEALDIPCSNRRLLYRATQHELSFASQILKELNLEGRHPLVGLQIASFATKSYRDWPTENFAELCKRIVAACPDARFVVFGGPEEAVCADGLVKYLTDNQVPIHSFAGKLSLRQTAALMSQLDIYVGVDTGPTHIMSTFDRPIIGLYHSRHPSSAYGPRNHPYSFPIDHPCRDDSNGEPQPMAIISVETVFQKFCQACATLNLKVSPRP